MLKISCSSPQIVQGIQVTKNKKPLPIETKSLIQDFSAQRDVFRYLKFQDQKLRFPVYLKHFLVSSIKFYRFTFLIEDNKEYLKELTCSLSQNTYNHFSPAYLIDNELVRPLIILSSLRRYL